MRRSSRKARGSAMTARSEWMKTCWRMRDFLDDRGDGGLRQRIEGTVDEVLLGAHLLSQEEHDEDEGDDWEDEEGDDGALLHSSASLALLRRPVISDCSKS
jgi:hypothetical protein